MELSYKKPQNRANVTTYSTKYEKETKFPLYDLR